jgi:succinoglycan biosynthesis protein ExoV
MRMKLYYWKTHPNLGDQLNPWLWPKIFPGFFDDDASHLFLGIGTILWSGYPKESFKHVFGAGYGIGDKPEIDDKWIFHCVRGPRTAQAFGLPISKAITDPAILVNALYSPPSCKAFTISLIPHWTHDKNYYRSICSRYGIHYISPLNADVKEVIDEIAASELIIAEAMHGAIVADALRIPWVPVDIHGVNELKWEDWCASLKLRYEPMRLPKLFPGRWLRKLVRRIKPLDVLYVSMFIKMVVNKPRVFLSDDSVFNRRLMRLWDEIENFRNVYVLKIN